MGLNTSTRHVSDVVTWVQRQFGDESSVQITQADIIRWLNQAQLEVAVVANPIQAISSTVLVPGTFQYTLPVENATNIISLRIDGTPIENMEFQTAELRIAREDPERQVSGKPQYWWRFADKIYMWPTPDSALSVDLFYFKNPDDLTSSGDLLGLPDKYYEALLQFVMSKAYELDEEYANSRAARQAFNDRIGITLEEDTRGSVEYYPTLTFLDD
jgi:hypothetical protein